MRSWCQVPSLTRLWARRATTSLRRKSPRTTTSSRADGTCWSCPCSRDQAHTASLVAVAATSRAPTISSGYVAPDGVHHKRSSRRSPVTTRNLESSLVPRGVSHCTTLDRSSVECPERARPNERHSGLHLKEGVTTGARHLDVSHARQHNAVANHVLHHSSPCGRCQCPHAHDRTAHIDHVANVVDRRLER